MARFLDTAKETPGVAATTLGGGNHRQLFGKPTMSTHDLIRIADHVRQSHIKCIPMRIPAMTVRELGKLTRLLEQGASHQH